MVLYLDLKDQYKHYKKTHLLVKCLKGGDIGGALDHLVDPLDCPHHPISLFLVEHWRALREWKLSRYVNPTIKIS